MSAAQEPLVIIGGTVAAWGLIPSFLDSSDPRPAAEQIDERYVSGWRPFKGFRFDRERGLLCYPGDPPLEAISALLFRNEALVLFPSDWLVILQFDDSWQVARVD